MLKLKGAGVAGKTDGYDGQRTESLGNILLFVGPYMLLFTIITVLPVLVAIGLSFTYFNVIQPPGFIGLQNYIRLFSTDWVFITALRNTILIALVTGPGGYLLSLAFAWLINELGPKLRAIVILFFYAPSISGNIYLIWSIVFSGDEYGYLNNILFRLGVINEPVVWLSNPKYMMGILLFVVLWSSFGTGFLAFVAGFQGIDRSLYEAGAIDGIRNRWQELWFITLPAIKPQMMFSAVMSITSAFGVGSVVTSLFGSPSADYAVHTVINHLEDVYGVRYEMGYACAIATLLFCFMFFTNILIKRLIERVGK